MPMEGENPRGMDLGLGAPLGYTSAMSSANPGLQSRSQRRGVMPLVLFWNFSGSSSAKSLKLRGRGESGVTAASGS